jgi:DNA-binding NtrC family response regulator
MAVIMITAYGSVETASSHEGRPFDYVTKPFKVETPDHRPRALEYHSALAENVNLKAQLEARYRLRTSWLKAPRCALCAR